jgi:pimeloyl-ACP methyl ester carboxylesterase
VRTARHTVRVSQIAAHHANSRRVDLSDGHVALLDASPRTSGSARATALLVPGYTGSKEDFAPLLDPLADAGYRVVAMDQPGQYESPGPDDPAAYTVAWLGSVVVGVAKELGDGPVHLLGHSFGGLVSRAAVLSEPSMFASLTLLGSGPAAIGGPRKDRMAALEPYLPHGMAAVYEAVEGLARFDPRWIAAPPELKAFLRQRFIASSPAGLKGMGDALLTEPDRVEDLAAAALPILVCHGEHDDAWQPETQAEMAKRLGARHEPVAGALHSPAVENPAALLPILRSFWDGIDK